MMKAYMINVFGKVQGVGFRYYTKLKADELGVRGTVENRSDGSVYIFAEANEKEILSFLEWCHKGPGSAAVDRLEYEQVSVLASDRFTILR